VGIWLDRATVAKLRAMRRPGDSFSDVILALAKDERV
jgi:predicted CopG family antitoxin